jgi:hypothetical protein
VGDEISEHYSRAKQLTDIQIWEAAQEASSLKMIGSFQDDINKRETASGLTTWLNGSFQTFASAGLNITTAISLSAAAYAATNEIQVRAGDKLKVTITLNLTSGLQPNIYLYASMDVRSNVVTLTPGINRVELTSTYTGPVRMFIEVAGASDFATTNTTINKMINRVFAANRGTFNVKSRIWKIDLIEL